MNIRLVFRVLLASLVITVLGTSPALAELRVVTSTSDLADFARTIGGDRVHVESICTGAQDPHHVQARPSYMVALSRADLLIAVGLELEVGWLPALIGGARNPSINPGKRGYLETAKFIKPIDVVKGSIDRSQGDIHPQGNPHFWLDPENAKLAVKAIAARMAELDPKNADYFQENRKRFIARIDQAMVRWTKKMAKYKGTKIVSYHRTFNYFHHRFGLVGVGYVEERPGIPPAPAHLARLILKMRQEAVPVIFHESYYKRSTSDMVGKRTKAKVLTLPISVGASPAASNYEKLIDTIIDTFIAAVPHE